MPFIRIVRIINIFNYILIFISRYIEKYCPSDLFITLDYDKLKKEENLFLWHGKLLIKEGVYNGAYFTFNLTFPNNYPNNSPNVEFKENIFHPLIDPVTNKLDVKYIFPSWIPGKNFCIQLLYKIKDIFMNPKYFFVSDSLNPESGKLFCDDYLEFEKRVQQKINLYKQENINSENDFIDNDLIKEFKNILKKEKISSNAKQDLLEKYFLFKYKPNDKK